MNDSPFVSKRRLSVRQENIFFHKVSKTHYLASEYEGNSVLGEEKDYLFTLMPAFF